MTHFQNATKMLKYKRISNACVKEGVNTKIADSLIGDKEKVAYKRDGTVFVQPCDAEGKQFAQ